jgi:ParB/RepB/Spo0J family partition protein
MSDFNPDLGFVKLSEIRENPDALRAVARDTEQYLELVESVKTHGVLIPINVRRMISEDGTTGYSLVDGLHRFSAASDVGLEEIPAQIVDMDDVQVYLAQIAANVHKVDTRPIEYTKGLLRVLSVEPTLTQSELASRIGKSPSWLSERLRLLKLDSSIQTLVNEGRIGLLNANALSKLPMVEQSNYVDQAMVMPAQEFVPLVEGRAKELREAAARGRKAEGPKEWAPTPHLRKMTELKECRDNGTFVSDLLAKHNVTDAVAAGKFMMDWVLNLDPDGVERQSAKHEQRQATLKAAREARKAERLRQKADEAAAAAEKAGV